MKRDFQQLVYVLQQSSGELFEFQGQVGQRAVAPFARKEGISRNSLVRPNHLEVEEERSLEVRNSENRYDWVRSDEG